MKYKKNILLIILIISSLCLILLPKSIKGSVNDIFYEFENDILYNSDNPIYESFNMDDNITSFTQTYKASYSFTNETDGTEGTDIIFIDESEGGNVSIIAQFNGHDKVIKYLPNIAYNSIDNNFEEASGIIEFWISNSDVSAVDLQMGVWEGATSLVLIGISPAGFYYYDIHVRQDFGSPQDNEWYHFRIDFDCGTDTFDLSVNGILEVSGSDFYDPGVSANKFRMRPSSTTIYTYIDAIGYSWLTNYTVNQNIIPDIEIDYNLKQISGYEFVFKDVNEKLDWGDDDFETWNEVEDGGDDVNIAMDWNDWYNPLGAIETQSKDRVVEIKGSNSQTTGLRKHDFGLNGSRFVNITCSLNFTQYDTGNSIPRIVIYSSHYSIVLELRFLNIAGTIKLNNLNVGYIELYSGININDLYVFNMFINYEIDTAFLLLYENGLVIGYWLLPIVSLNEEGIGQIEFMNIAAVGDTVIFNVDYCRIYIDGISKVEDGASYGYIDIPLGDNEWRFNEENLFTCIISGKVLIYKNVGLNIYRPYFPDMVIALIRDFKTYSNVSELINLYDVIDHINSYTHTSAVMYFKESFSINYLNIEGVALKEGLNSYNLEFTHSGVDTNESYFYVDLDNKLQFTLITNDTDNEYIQADFNITNVDSTDRGISFRGSIIDKAFGYFAVNYLIGISFNDIPIFQKTTRAILPLNKTIDTFIVLITDNDIDSIIGTTTGFVSQPILLSISGIGLPIITAGLIEMMIPLIMIIVPTLLISQGFGKEGKKLIIPLFFIFSAITTITLITPIWILFIIIFGVGLFLARNKEIEVK